MSPLSRNPRDATIQFRGSRRWVRCGVVLRVVTSTGLRSTGGSLSQGFRSVRSCSALLFGDRAARYVAVVWSGVDVLTKFLRVVRGAVVSVVVVWSGVDALGKTPQVFPRFRGLANRRVDLHLPLIASISGRRQ